MLRLAVLYDDNSDSGDEVSVCDGLEAPEDSALPMLISETDLLSAAPSVASVSCRVEGRDGFAFPNCSNH